MGPALGDLSASRVGLEGPRPQGSMARCKAVGRRCGEEEGEVPGPGWVLVSWELVFCLKSPH